MKLLRLLTRRQQTGGRLALLGGIVLWISGSIATPAHAAPTNYEIDPGGFFSGTFTLDSSPTGQFSNWVITGAFPLGITQIFDEAFQNTPLSNGCEIDIRTLCNMTLEQVVGPKSFVFHVPQFLGFAFDASASLDGGLNHITQNGTYHEASGNVPEPAAAVLLAIGLVALTGLHWLPRRGARQELG